MASFRCAICEKESTYEGRLPREYPFCGERCRLVDLGRWFREQYSIDRDLRPEDFEKFDTLHEHPERGS